MPILELIVGLVGKLVPAIVDSIKSSQLSAEEKARLLAQVSSDLDAAAARVAAAEIRDV